MATHFVIFHMYDTPTFKTKMLCLVNNEGQVKRLLLLYKQLMLTILANEILVVPFILEWGYQYHHLQK